MSSFELNKLTAALILAVMIGMISSILAGDLVHPVKLAQNAYPIAGAEPAAEAKPAAPVAAAKPTPIPVELLAKADAAAGEVIAKKCAACHSFDKGGANKVGPNLWGVITRARASIAGFQYSDTLKALGGSWSPQEIAAFIYSPKDYAPGTKMGFAGLPKPEDRANVLAFLNKNTDSPVDLAAAK